MAGPRSLEFLLTQPGGFSSKCLRSDRLIVLLLLPPLRCPLPEVGWPGVRPALNEKKLEFLLSAIEKGFVTNSAPTWAY